jgi:predicted  nucleic acid-binding Zn-ribbon protein
VSKDVERLTRQLSGATNISQVGMLKERIDSLSGTQRRLVMDIVELCAAVPDLQQKFLQLDRQLESVRQQVNDASQMDELERLRAQIDPLVSEWAESFQELVMRTLQGAPG